jgi:hypothetical protein
MGLVMKQLEKLPEAELDQIRQAALQHRHRMLATVA